MPTEILSALALALSPEALFANALGVGLGIIFGALPGLTAVMGIALLLPLTFSLPTAEAFSALLGMYCGAIYGGAITAILIGTPGTVAAAATMLEGPAFTARGESKKALDMATFASFFGGIFSCIVLILLAPVLASFAIAFGAPEYFAVAIFGMAIVASLSANAPIKGAISALLGIYISTIGGDSISGELRNTFGFVELVSGLSLVPVLIGLFAISQIFISLENFLFQKVEDINIKINYTKFSLKNYITHKFNLIRSSIVGVVVGIIPATGGGTASYIAYSMAKKYSDTPEEFGNGSLEGIAATESSNNATTGGALIPLLTLGVPGDICTAIILGALMIQGLVPGPLLFKNDPVAVYSIFTALTVSNIFMLVLGLLAIRPLTKILLIPNSILMPIVMTLCVVGAYSSNTLIFDVYVVGIFGIIGYLMHKINMPTAPLLLAMILGPLAEVNFRRALMLSDNDYSVFFTSPIAMTLFVISILVIIRTFRAEMLRRKQEENEKR